MSSIAERIRALRGWEQDCKFLLQWELLPRPQGWVEFSAFDPALIRGELDRITLIDVTDASEPVVLIRGERLNGATTQIAKGEKFLESVAEDSRALLAAVMIEVSRRPCIAVHDVLYQTPDGALAARGEVVLLPFVRSGRGQKLVMACTRLDEVQGRLETAEIVEIAAQRLAYFDFGYGAPDASAEAAVHRLDLRAGGEVA